MAAKDKQTGRVEKIKRKYGQNAFVKFGALGGSPVLESLVEHRPVKGYRATRVGKGSRTRNKRQGSK